MFFPAKWGEAGSRLCKSVFVKSGHSSHPPSPPLFLMMSPQYTSQQPPNQARGEALSRIQNYGCPSVDAPNRSPIFPI